MKPMYSHFAETIQVIPVFDLFLVLILGNTNKETNSFEQLRKRYPTTKIAGSSQFIFSNIQLFLFSR
jgi:hypothetical protein